MALGKSAIRQPLTSQQRYTDEKLDVEFIDTLSEQLLRYVYSKSTPPPDTLFPTGHPGYPTLADAHKWIATSGITSIDLSRQDVQALLLRLVYDGTLERLQISDLPHSDDEEYGGDREAWAYRGVPGFRDVGNPVTDIPCGTCPVAGFCEPGGPVSPEGCVYYQKWLSF